MQLINNIKLKNKLILMLVVPIVGMVVFSVLLKEVNNNTKLIESKKVKKVFIESAFFKYIIVFELIIVSKTRLFLIYQCLNKLLFRFARGVSLSNIIS